MFGARNYSNTQAFTVLPGTHLLLGRESARVSKVPCLGAQRRSTFRAAGDRTRDLSLVRLARYHWATTPPNVSNTRGWTRGWNLPSTSWYGNYDLGFLLQSSSIWRYLVWQMVQSRGFCAVCDYTVSCLNSNRCSVEPLAMDLRQSQYHWKVCTLFCRLDSCKRCNKLTGVIYCMFRPCSPEVHRLHPCPAGLSTCTYYCSLWPLRRTDRLSNLMILGV